MVDVFYSFPLLQVVFRSWPVPSSAPCCLTRGPARPRYPGGTSCPGTRNVPWGVVEELSHLATFPPRSGDCLQFPWGGCRGNGNNFLTAPQVRDLATTISPLSAVRGCLPSQPWPSLPALPCSPGDWWPGRQGEEGRGGRGTGQGWTEGEAGQRAGQRVQSGARGRALWPEDHQVLLHRRGVQEVRQEYT